MGNNILRLLKFVHRNLHSTLFSFIPEDVLEGFLYIKIIMATLSFCEIAFDGAKHQWFLKSPQLYVQPELRITDMKKTNFDPSVTYSKSSLKVVTRFCNLKLSDITNLILP